MSNRITNQDLQDCCNTLNRGCGYALEPHGTDEDGKYKPNPNVYHVSGAYGGVALDQMMPEGSGTRRVSCDGFDTKRKLYSFMLGMIAGFDANKPERK